MTCNPDQGFYAILTSEHHFAMQGLKYPSDLCDEPPNTIKWMASRYKRVMYVSIAVEQNPYSITLVNTFIPISACDIFKWLNKMLSSGSRQVKFRTQDTWTAQDFINSIQDIAMKLLTILCAEVLAESNIPVHHARIDSYCEKNSLWPCKSLAISCPTYSPRREVYHQS